jgi:hypothetical protein
MDSGRLQVSKHIKTGKKSYNHRILEARFLVTGHKEPGTSGDAGEEKAMRRFAVVLSAVAALMLVWTGTALAQEGPPGCNGSIFLSGSSVQDGGNGTTPKFAHGDTVTVSGEGFDPNQLFDRWDVVDVNSGGTVVLSSETDWNADASGNFSFSFSTSTLTDDHEYKVTVYFTKEVGSESCQKSKNFFLVSEEGGGAGGQPPPPPPPPAGGAGGQPPPPPPPPSGGGGGSLGGEAGGGGGQGALPFTGVSFAVLGLAGLVLLLGGLGLMRSGRTQ